MRTTCVEDDTQIWIVTGSHYCSAAHCSQPAVIVAAAPRHERFCVDHALAAVQPAFAGWYRISSAHYVANDLIATVHPL
jgi:hypothetical protein